AIMVKAWLSGPAKSAGAAATAPAFTLLGAPRNQKRHSNINSISKTSRLARGSHRRKPPRGAARAEPELREPTVRPTLRRVLALAAALIAVLAATPAGAASRIKDLANIEGVRQNQLIGYGLVVGLNGTGDTLNNIPFTKQSLTAMLERLGVNIR